MEVKIGIEEALWILDQALEAKQKITKDILNSERKEELFLELLEAKASLADVGKALNAYPRRVAVSESV